MNSASKFFLMDPFFGAEAKISHVLMWSTFFKICLDDSELSSGLLCSDHLVRFHQYNLHHIHICHSIFCMKSKGFFSLTKNSVRSSLAFHVQAFFIRKLFFCLTVNFLKIIVKIRFRFSRYFS